MLLHVEDMAKGSLALLLHMDLPGPALSLSRLMLETYARSLWATWDATDEETLAFAEGGRHSPDWKQLTLSNLRQRLLKHKDAHVKEEAEWIDAHCKLNGPLFNGLVHTDWSHISARLDENGLRETQYDPTLVEQWIGFNRTLRVNALRELLFLLDLPTGRRAHLEEFNAFLLANPQSLDADH